MSKDRNPTHVGVYTTNGFKAGMTATEAQRAGFIVIQSAVKYRQHVRRMANIRKSLGFKGD